jgi:ankyrin repeat protein
MTTINLADQASKGRLTVEEIKHYTKERLLQDISTAGYNIMYSASYGSSPEVLAALLDQGLDVNMLTIADYTALLGALTSRRWDNVKLLLSRGANVQLATIGHTTALHIAAENGASNEIIQAIFDAGGDPNAKNSSGKKPIDMARMNNHVDTALYIQEMLHPSNVKSAKFIA